MSLTPGTTLGPYEVVAEIGKGGMGEVYRARDTKLDRDVALKVLPQAFTDDPDRLARFEREAKVLASLNHANIGGIHGLEESDGVKALVLEYIEGPTLADRIKQGPIPVDEALPIAKQIAEALEAAHEQGIIHRDLKPANIKLRPDGTVKVLDFGLAKGLAGVDHETDSSQTVTVTHAATEAGVILGTAPYMSPEQVRGTLVDKRTDVWAFGCVLYEMLTCRRAFGAGTMPDTLAGVLDREPDWDALPSSTPHRIADLLGRCLRKKPARRLRDLGDAAIEIDDTWTGADAAEPAAASSRHWLTAGLLAVAGLAVGVALWAVVRSSPETAAAVSRLVVTLPPDQGVVLTPGAYPLAVSPGGERLVYVAASGGQRRLMLRELDAFEARSIRSFHLMVSRSGSFRRGRSSKLT